MATSPELEQLLRVLDERSLGLGHDDVAWAFESPKTNGAITSWVQEYLSPATLLTREETTLLVSHTLFRVSGLTVPSQEKRDSTKAGNSTSGPFISDEDFESAISTLEASTASIEQQCKLLEAQKKALQEIQARNATSQMQSTQAQRSSKFTREKAQAEFEASELAESLQSQIDRSLKQSETATDSIQSTVERVLEKDDRLLDGLQKVLPQLADATTSSRGSEEIERLCSALIMYSSAEIHARMDAAFQSAAYTDRTEPNGTRSSSMSSQGKSMRTELEELCREIDGLSNMVVESQYRNPIMKALGTAKTDSDDERAQWMQYMSATLHYLISRLDCLEDGTHQLRSQHSALKTVSTALDSILAMTVDRKQSSKSLSQSPIKASQKGLKPLRLVQANLSESQDPAAQLLRHLDVRATDSRDSVQLAENLETAFREKDRNLSTLSARTESTVTELISRSIAKADANAQPLLSGVYAYSPFGTVSLVSSEATAGIDQLEGKTQSLSDKMRELDVDRIGRVVREKQQVLLDGQERRS